MILINFGIQDGENEYQQWDCNTNFSITDYENGKVKDLDLLQNMYGTMSVYDDGFDDNKYWLGDRLVWVWNVKAVNQEELDIIRKYV